MSRYCSRCRTAYAEERFCPLDGGVVVDAREAGDRLIGQTLAGRYMLVRGIGQGGMGAVYEAEHTGLGKRVAVKLLLDTYSDDREVLARFHQEARTASRIGHENIIDILDIGDHDGRSFIVMEFLEGHDLRHATRDVRGGMAVERACHIVRQIARALDAAHAKDVIHRDMKPENVFLTTRSGARDFVKIMDFGISKIKAAHDSQVRLTQTGAVIGTPLYMAPEQALGSPDIDQRADIYSLGVMMYELFTGRPPFEAPTYLALMAQHLNEPPRPPRALRGDLPPLVEKTILRALEKDPARRFPSMSDLERSLPAPTPASLSGPTQVAGGSPMTATNVATMARGPRPRRVALAIGGLAVLAAATAVGVVLAARAGRGGGREKQAGATPGPAPERPAQPEVEPQVQPLESIGAIDLQSEPSRAMVYLDGEPQGPTPLVLERVASGPHQIRFELDGYQPFETTRTVRAGATDGLLISLVKAGTRGKAKVSVTPRAKEPPKKAVADTPPPPVQEPEKEPEKLPEPEREPEKPKFSGDPRKDQPRPEPPRIKEEPRRPPQQPDPKDDDPDRKKSPYLRK
jgi:serine/threonine-protein kinase